MPEIEPEIDTFNRFMVGVHGDAIVFPFAGVPRRLTKAEAISLAAWLVALSDESEGHASFNAVLTAVCNT